MKNTPKKIYLQVDDDGERPEDFDGLVGISWCADKINDSDIEYVLVADTETQDRFENITKVKDELYYKCEQLQAEKAELIDIVKLIAEWGHDYSSTLIRLMAKDYLKKHETK